MKKLITTAIAFCAISMSYAYTSLQEAYDAKDFTYIATNTQFKYIQKRTFIQTKSSAKSDFGLLSDAYLAAGMTESAIQCANLAQDPVHWINAMQAIQANGFLMSSGKYVVSYNKCLEKSENASLLKSLALLTAECLNSPEKASKASLPYMQVRYLSKWNSLHPNEQISTDFTPTAVKAYASSTNNVFTIKAFNFGKSKDLIAKSYSANDIVIKTKAFDDDRMLYNFAIYADFAIGVGNVSKPENYFKTQALSKFKTCYYKTIFACKLKNADALVDALAGIKPDIFTAKEINNIIVILNGLSVDFKREKVNLILQNINAMYTIKLYDDRDAWEPVLSKVRAMIDARS